MQLRAIRLGLSQVEVPVRCRRRIGRSKISGNPRTVVLAAYDMLATFLRLTLVSRIEPGSKFSRSKNKSAHRSLYRL